MQPDFNLLTIPPVTRKPFKRHFLSEVVTELRFATQVPLEKITAVVTKADLDSIGFAGVKPSDIYQTSLTIDKTGTQTQNMKIGLRYEAKTGRIFQVQADRLIWAQNASYGGFEDYAKEMSKAFSLVQGAFSSAKVKRVGLRKVDSIQIGTSKGLPEILTHFNDSLFATCRNQIAATDEVVGGDTLNLQANNQQIVVRSSLKRLPGAKDSKSQFQIVLDFDLAFFEPGCTLESCHGYLEALNKSHYTIFSWAITDKLRGVLNS